MKKKFGMGKLYAAMRGHPLIKFILGEAGFPDAVDRGPSLTDPGALHVQGRSRVKTVIG